MYGFPEDLYRIHYRPQGSRELTDAVLDLLGSRVEVDDTWGIDHGVWTPLHHMVPDAHIPVVELSVDGTRDAAWAYETGELLAPLREHGFAIMGSGNIVHNLREVVDRPDGAPQAVAFSNAARDAVLKRQDQALIGYKTLPHASWAVPMPDHFLPLVTILGATQGETPEVFNDVQNLGAVSMTSFAFGLDA